MSVSRKILKAAAGLGRIDPFFNQTTLLLHGDGTNGGQNNTFLDSSTNNFTLTRNGNTTQGSFSPYSVSGPYNPATHGGSGYFDGSGDYLSNTTTALIGSTVSTFTFEGWIYMSANPTSDANNISGLVTLDGQPAGNINYLSFGPVSNRVLYLRWFDGAGKTAIGSTTLNTNQWYHIACVVNSNAIQFYVDGVAESMSGTTTLTNRNGTSGNFSIGQNFYGAISGYLSDVRVTTTAVYTSAFTSPTAPLTAVSGTELLCNFTNAAIFDSTAKNVLETVGDAQIDTAVKKFGTGSMEFDGTGDYLVMPITQDLQFGSGDFTIEGWINVPSIDATYRCILSIGPPVQIYARSGTIEVYFNDGDNASTYIVNGTTGPASSISTNTWAHFAVVRDGTTFTVYVDGVAGTPATGVSASVATSATAPALGIALATANLPYTGYIDDLRITKGVARYTANFTPPDRAFPDQ